MRTVAVVGTGVIADVGAIAHVLEHLGPPTEAWWRDLGDPSLTPSLVAKIVDGTTDALAGTDPVALVARRDAMLHTLLAAKDEAARNEGDLP